MPRIVSAIVDSHAHIILRSLTQDFAPTESWRPRLSQVQGRTIVKIGERPMTSAREEVSDPGAIVEVERARGIDHVVLSPWVNLLCYEASPEEGLRISRLQNEGLAQVAADHAGAVSCLGQVPLQDPVLAARELESTMHLPGLRGVEVAATVKGVYLGDDMFRPFWEAAEALGALVFIHPRAIPADSSPYADYYLWNTLGIPLETTVTIAHMTMAGVMERHPSLRVVVAHGGGAILSLRGRLAHAYEQSRERGRLRGTPDESLKRFYFDTITHDQATLRALLDYVGAEHVLLGSDYPFDMGLAHPVETVRALGLAEDDEAKVLGQNAVGLLGLRSLPV